MTPRTWQCVAFDLDGTLVDSFPALRRAYESFLGSFGMHGSDEEFARLNGPSMDTVVRLLKDWRSLPGNDEELRVEYHRHVGRSYREGIPAMPGAVELLELARAAGWDRALVTSSPRRVVDEVLSGLGWQETFTVIACGDEVSESKPDPALYRLACERGGWRPAECVAIEDAEAGVRAAKRCGLAVIGFGAAVSGERLRQAGADWTCDSLGDAGEILRREGRSYGLHSRR